MASPHYDMAAEKRRHDLSLRMNKARWDAERIRRNKLADMEPIQHPGKIVLRVVVIRNGSDVQECVVFDNDSDRDARLKLKKVMQPKKEQL